LTLQPSKPDALPNENLQANLYRQNSFCIRMQFHIAAVRFAQVL
jgi:hypothetical protein